MDRQALVDLLDATKTEVSLCLDRITILFTELDSVVRNQVTVSTNLNDETISHAKEMFNQGNAKAAFDLVVKRLALLLAANFDRK